MSWHSHIWTWWGTSALLTHVFDIFRSHWVPFLCPTRSYWPHFSAEKIGLSLSHLVPEVIWPKVGLKFHTNLSFDHFEAFVPIFFLLDFRSNWPPFLQFLDLFDPSFLQNLRSCWVHFFIACWTLNQKFGEVPPPLPGLYAGYCLLMQMFAIFTFHSVNFSTINIW